MKNEMRVVFDTNTVLSALLFQNSKLSWLRTHWRMRQVVPLISQKTAAELIRVLAYPKFKLSWNEIEILLADYLPYCETVMTHGSLPSLPRCRDAHDQMFLELALEGGATIIVTGDKDLQTLRNHVPFSIETPTQYRKRFFSEESKLSP